MVTSKTFLVAETVERRILGALRFVDGNTATPIYSSMHIQAAGLQLRSNSRYEYIITSATGFKNVTSVFESDDVPTLTSKAFMINVTDPSGNYLPRQAILNLPRDIDPANSSGPDSVFKPIDISLYPSPAANIASGWATISATVTDQNQNRLGGVLFVLTRDEDGEILARGVSEWNGRIKGESLITIPGLAMLRSVAPISEEDDGLELIESTPVTVLAIYDPVLNLENNLPDLDELEANAETLKTVTITLNLTAGRSFISQVTINLA